MYTDKILTLIIYFSTGFFIPVLSRFLMKFYPCSLHSYLGDILKHNFNKNKIKTKYQKNKFKLLKKQYFYNKIIWGFGYLILLTSVEYFLKPWIIKDLHLNLIFIFLFLLGFASNIDNRCRLIPDIITFPLLMVAFLFSATLEKSGIISPINISTLESIYSSIGAYLLCAFLAFLFYFKNPYSFGGGDIKIIAGIAAFTGFKSLGVIFVYSFVIGIITYIFKKERYVPLAPLLFKSFIIWIFISISNWM